MTNNEVVKLLERQLSLLSEVSNGDHKNLTRLTREMARIADALARWEDKAEREGKDAPAVHPYEADGAARRSGSDASGKTAWETGDKTEVQCGYHDEIGKQIAESLYQHDKAMSEARSANEAHVDDRADDIANKLADIAEARERRTVQMEEYPQNLRLYVRDKSNGETHLIGTDVHDRLYVGIDGIVRYENMQNGCGVEYADPITIDVRSIYGGSYEYLLHCVKSVGAYEFVPTPEDEL